MLFISTANQADMPRIKHTQVDSTVWDLHWSLTLICPYWTAMYYLNFKDCSEGNAGVSRCICEFTDYFDFLHLYKATAPCNPSFGEYIMILIDKTMVCTILEDGLCLTCKTLMCLNVMHAVEMQRRCRLVPFTDVHRIPMIHGIISKRWMATHVINRYPHYKSTSFHWMIPNVINISYHWSWLPPGALMRSFKALCALDVTLCTLLRGRMFIWVVM